MAKKVSKEEFDKYEEKMKKEYNYDDMSDEQKEKFDGAMDNIRAKRMENPDDEPVENDRGERKRRDGKDRDDDDFR